ncbi:protein of unknown function [Magnetospirillum sp. XM-1]|nr:protein of unknown function [Magnetospirillum sp. XM-1]
MRRKTQADKVGCEKYLWRVFRSGGNGFI